MREGTVIGGRYVLGGLLGSGGMGRVYRAHDENLRREVALKVMEERHAGTPEFVERFRREVTNAASLDHPNVVRVFDSGKDESGPPYMAMELIGGGTLKDRIRARGLLPPREVATIALQVAEALGAAHEAGIVHRDVKPENVLLTEDGQAKVADFGIAKATEATSVTHTSMILGTAPYLSPEQAQGKPVGPASDLYSLGVVLFEALTGRPPFGTGEDVSPLAVAMKHLNEPAPPARTKNPHVPEPLEKITLALMRKDPAERHASAAILVDDLAAFLDGRPLRSKAAAMMDGSSDLAATGVLPRAAVQDPAPRRRRRRVVPVLAVALAAVLALAASPLTPGDPLGLGTRLVSTEPTSVGDSVFPEVRQAPSPPEPPEERATAPEPETPDPEPDPGPDPEPTPVDETAPSDTTPTASASAAGASASAAAEPDTAEPETAEPDTAELDPADPDTTDASASASASATAAEEQSVPEPAPQADQSSPSSAAPSSSPPPPAPVTPEPPDVEPPEVEIPEF